MNEVAVHHRLVVLRHDRIAGGDGRLVTALRSSVARQLQFLNAGAGHIQREMLAPALLEIFDTNQVDAGIKIGGAILVYHTMDAVVHHHRHAVDQQPRAVIRTEVKSVFALGLHLELPLNYQPEIVSSFRKISIGDPAICFTGFHRLQFFKIRQFIPRPAVDAVLEFLERPLGHNPRTSRSRTVTEAFHVGDERLHFLIINGRRGWHGRRRTLHDLGDRVTDGFNEIGLIKLGLGILAAETQSDFTFLAPEIALKLGRLHGHARQGWRAAGNLMAGGTNFGLEQVSPLGDQFSVRRGKVSGQPHDRQHW